MIWVVYLVAAVLTGCRELALHLFSKQPSKKEV